MRIGGFSPVTPRFGNEQIKPPKISPVISEVADSLKGVASLKAAMNRAVTWNTANALTQSDLLAHSIIQANLFRGLAETIAMRSSD